jgi:hypothetical protein
MVAHLRDPYLWVSQLLEISPEVFLGRAPHLADARLLMRVKCGMPAYCNI